MDDKPNQHNTDEENSVIDNNFLIHDNINVSPNEEPFNDFFERERKGKRKVEEDGEEEEDDDEVIHDDTGTSNRPLDQKKARLNSDFKLSEEGELDLALSLSVRDSRSLVECANSSTKSTTSTSIKLLGVEIEVHAENQHYPSSSENSREYLTHNSNDPYMRPRLGPPALPEAAIVNQYDNIVENQINLNVSHIPANDIQGAIAVQPMNQPQGNVNANWPITKNLTPCDVRQRQNRLLIGSEMAQYIMNHLGEESRENVEKGKGINVIVHDQDTNEDFLLRFNRFPSTQGHVLNGRWHGDFVVRRALKIDDQIGIRWNIVNNILVFTVLNRVPPD
ncbi:hypothetical protein RND81_10G128200 [Saponaria officinalis]|uniref:B3 domain-containing protein n=1 Tax=Saponaria officinalis TaxID=3572 RepID=A0AAW1I400_SAPOF